MANLPVEDRNKLRRVWNDHAIQLAMKSRWADAVATNRNILELFPNDVDALNRLGRALREQGLYRDARETYQRAVTIDPNNAIAQRNLASLSTVDVDRAPVDTQERVDPRIFSAEAGKSGNAALVRVPDRALIARLTVGDRVYLFPEGRALFVRNGGGDVLGQVEPKIAQRLIDLIRGGSEYAAAIMSADEHSPRILIHETLQHPSQAGKVAFPNRVDTGTTIRPYTRESQVRYSDYDDEDDDGDAEQEFTTEVEPEGEEVVEPSEFEDEQQPE
ncbi:MAG: tetratricopeptide repeat protein [Chloroflexota bacterium]|nr:MAG: tetratricopeptide repeat protein [Chloroflexota bacterium]